MEPTNAPNLIFFLSIGDFNLSITSSLGANFYDVNVHGNSIFLRFGETNLYLFSIYFYLFVYYSDCEHSKYNFLINEK